MYYRIEYIFYLFAKASTVSGWAYLVLPIKFVGMSYCLRNSGYEKKYGKHIVTPKIGCCLGYDVLNILPYLEFLKRYVAITYPIVKFQMF